MKLPVRRRTDADATAPNQLNVTGIFCGKLSQCPVGEFVPPIARQKTGKIRAFLLVPSWPETRHGGGLTKIIAVQIGRTAPAPQKGKTRPGGQPDGSSYIWALGWMGARAGYSCGEGLPIPH